MSIFVKNISNNTFVDIQNIQMLGIQERKLSNGSKGFAIVVYHDSPSPMGRVGYVLGEFSDKADALEYYEKLVRYKLQRTDRYEYLEIENKTKASIIEIPTEHTNSNIVK